MALVEGTEWTDGFFHYIAYRKRDGRMVVRDVEGFDYSEEAWEQSLAEDDGQLVLVDVSLEPQVRIERWEGEVEFLPR